MLTDQPELADLARSLRAHGWIRDMGTRDAIAAEHSEIDPRYLFISAGYNLRPTEIQGAFGIHQLAKLEPFIEVRRENARHWNQHLRRYADWFMVPEETEGTRHVWFGYPIHVRSTAPFSRASLAQFLEEHQIETRPIMAGNLVDQPVMRLYEHRHVGTLAHAQEITRSVILIGNHHGIGLEEREYVTKCVDDFVTHIRRSVR